MMNKSEMSIELLPILACINTQWALHNTKFMSMNVDSVPEVLARIDSRMIATSALVLALDFGRRKRIILVGWRVL